MLLKIAPAREDVETLSDFKSQLSTPSELGDRAPQSFGQTVGFQDLCSDMSEQRGGVVPPSCRNKHTKIPLNITEFVLFKVGTL